MYAIYQMNATHSETVSYNGKIICTEGLSNKEFIATLKKRRITHLVFPPENEAWSLGPGTYTLKQCEAAARKFDWP